MMDYEFFKKEIENRFMAYMPRDMQSMKVVIRKVDKVNITLDGVSIVNEGEKTQAYPVIYVNDLYKHYIQCGDLDKVLRMAAQDMLGAIKKNITIPDKADIKNNIVFQLINTIQNQKLLANIPSRPFNDLSIIYRWVVQINGDGISSTVVNNSLAEWLGLNEMQLFKLAEKNTRRILPPCVKSMNEFIYEIFIKNGIPMENADMELNGLSTMDSMWVISNNRGINGAAAMLCEDELYMLAESMGSDLYILPSSVHEVIAVSTNMGEPEKLAQMVADVNVEQVDIQERLSDQVYHYDKNLRTLTLAAGTPYKKLQWETE